MRIALIADSFPPLRTSSAVQLRDLSREIVRQGHKLTVLLPSSEIKSSSHFEVFDGVQVLRLRAPKTKDINYIKRTINEFLMPFEMHRNLQLSSFANEQWEGVIWYSPSIFLAPFASTIKNKSGCKSYLIIRDIFPDWAADMGLMRRWGFPFRFFDAIARYQYSVADVIGVQTIGNLSYFNRWRQKPNRKLEILNNWLGRPAQIPCKIRVNKTLLAGRKIFVYAGNMGVAQSMDILLNLAGCLEKRDDVGFLFIGRGSEAIRLKNDARIRGLSNTLFFDEINPDEIPDLYSQCSIGMVALDHRHRSHNIPGKFLTYMQSGLPVLANINTGNDLAKLIREERVGQVNESNKIEVLIELAECLLDQILIDRELQTRCRQLYEREYTSEAAVRQILLALSS